MSDNNHFEKIYTEHLPRIYNFFLYRFGDEALAEDLTSITFEKAWMHRDRYRHKIAAFSTWLFTIARRTAIDYYRQLSHAALRMDDVNSPVDGELPEDLMQQKSDLQRLEDLLGQLSARERELVAFKYGADMSNRAIARLTGLSESNVGVILHRTLLLLRKEWEVVDE